MTEILSGLGFLSAFIIIIVLEEIYYRMEKPDGRSFISRVYNAGRKNISFVLWYACGISIVKFMRGVELTSWLSWVDLIGVLAIFIFMTLSEASRIE